VAAALHLGLLDNTRVPGEKELLQIPLFDGTWEHDHGRLFFFGFDEQQREVYVLGKRGLGQRLNTIVARAAVAAGIAPGDYLLVDALPYVSWLMVVGGYSSRRLRWEKAGRKVVIKGIQTFFWQIVNKVEQVKRLPPVGTAGFSQAREVKSPEEVILTRRIIRSFWLAWGFPLNSLDLQTAIVNNE